MSKEYKKISYKNETRYVLENTSAGGAVTSAASVASNGQTPTKGLGALRRRLGELKDKIEVKGTGRGHQRNPVERGIIAQGGQSGAGAHQRRDVAAKSGKGKGKRDFQKFHGDLGENDRVDGDTGNTLYLKFNKRKDFWTINAGYALRAGDLRHQKYVDRAEKLIVTERDLDRYIRELKLNDEFNEVDKIRVVVKPEVSYPEEITNFLDKVEKGYYTDNNIEVSLVDYEEHDEHERRGKVKRTVVPMQFGGKTAEKTKMVYFKVIDPTMKKAMMDAGMKMEGDTFVLPLAKYDTFLKTVSDRTKKDPSEFIKRVNRDLEERTMFGDRQDGGSAPWREIENIYGKSTSFEEDRDHPDHEISMAKSELMDIVRDAIELLGLVKMHTEEEGLEAWQQSKITKAADYVHSVVRSLSADKKSDQFTEDSKKKLKPQVREYKVERPDGSIATYYEVLDAQGMRIPGQGTHGFDSKERARQALRKYVEKNIKEGLVYYDDEILPTFKKSDEAIEYLQKIYPHQKNYTLKSLESPFRLYFNPLSGLRSAQNIGDIDAAITKLNLRYNPKLSGTTLPGVASEKNWYTLENPDDGLALVYQQGQDKESDNLNILSKTDDLLTKALKIIKDANIVPDNGDIAEPQTSKVKSKIQKVISKGFVPGTRFKYMGGELEILDFTKDGNVRAQDPNTNDIKIINPASVIKQTITKHQQEKLAEQLKTELYKIYNLKNNNFTEGLKGAAVGGIAGAVIAKSVPGAITGAEIGSDIEDLISKDNTQDNEEVKEFQDVRDDGNPDKREYLLNLAQNLEKAMYGPEKNIERIKSIKQEIQDLGGSVKISWNTDSTFDLVMYHPQYFKQGHLIHSVGRGDDFDKNMSEGIIRRIFGIKPDPRTRPDLRLKPLTRWVDTMPPPPPKSRRGADEKPVDPVFADEWERLTGKPWPGPVKGRPWHGRDQDKKVAEQETHSLDGNIHSPVDTQTEGVAGPQKRWPETTTNPYDLEEISNKTVSNYVSRVADIQTQKLGGIQPNMYGKIEQTFGNKGTRRKQGVDRAMNRLFGTPRPEAEADENSEKNFDPIDEVTGDPKFDMMMSKIVGGANVQMLAHQFAEKIKNFPKYLDNDDKEYFDHNNEDPMMNGRFPNGYWLGHDGWHHSTILNNWKSMGFKKWATRIDDSDGIWDDIGSTDMYHNYWNDYFDGKSVANKIQNLPEELYYPVMREVWKEIFGQYPTDTQTEGVAGPQKCWPGHRKVGTQPGTGKNKGKRVNKCKKIKKKVKENTYIDSLSEKLNNLLNNDNG